MALTLTNLPKFVKTTFAKYTALETKDANTLYFITDATGHHIYLGSHQYSFNVVTVETDPTTSTEGITTGTIYYNTVTGVASIYDGTAVRKLSVAKSSDISGLSEDDGTVPTSYAAKTYADSAASAAASSAAAPKLDKISGTNGNLLTVASAGSAVADSGKAVGGATLAASPNSNTVATEAAVKAYADTAVAPKLDKISGTNGNVLTVASAGSAVADSGKSIGGATLAATPSSDVLATEAAVKSAADTAESTAKSYADSLISGLGSVMEFKGTKADMTALNAVTKPETGDVYHVTTGANGTAAEYVWDGTAWEELGTTIDMSNYMQKVASATSGHVATLNAAGEALDSGKSLGGATLESSPSSAVLATEAAVKAYADTAAADAASSATADKLDKITATDGNVLTAASNGTAVQDSGMRLGGAAFESTPMAQCLATEEGAAAYANSAASSAAAPKLDKITGTNGNILTVASAGSAVADSGVAIGGATLAATPTSTTVATEAAVKAYADSKITKVASPTAGDLVTVTSAGELVDAGIVVGGATLAANPTSTTVATEAAVEAKIQDALSAIQWTTL